MTTSFRQVRIKQAIPLITAFIKAGIVPMLEGSPGIGKSGIVHYIAQEYNLLVIDLRLAQCEPPDLLGFPYANHATGRSGYLPMDTFPIEGDPLPINPATGKAYSGWLLFLDEMTSAVRAVQAAAYKIVLDRMVGLKKLHKNCAIVAAGNKDTDGAIVEAMSTALQSRMAWLELVVNADDFMDWGMRNGIDHRITDYIKFKPAQVYTFTPDHSDKTYACPRTWDMASRLLKVLPLEDRLLKHGLVGTISEGVALEFINFCRVYDQIPKLEIILQSPLTTPMPVEPSYLYALTGSLSNNASKSNIDSMIKYVKRMGKEFQVMTLKETVRRDSSMMENQRLIEWADEIGLELFS
jgi:hypothetical protein